MEPVTVYESDIHPLLVGAMPPSEKENYLNGCCHIFVLALHEITGLQIAAFVENRAVFEDEDGTLSSIPFHYYDSKTDTRKFKEIGEGLVHAFCLIDDHSELIFDALGIRHVDQLNTEYEIRADTFLRMFDIPNDVLKYGHTFGIRDKDIDVYVSKTKDYINTYLSDDLVQLKN